MGDAKDIMVEDGTKTIRESVSIVLPTYNRAHLVGRAIQSILEQTYSEFELLVIDDGSVDDTEKVVKAYEDARIQYYKLEQNCGPAHARNIGIKNAKSKYIAFHDSDDVWHKEKLEKQMEVLTQAPEQVGLVYGCCKYHGLAGKIDYFPQKEIELEKKQGYIYPKLLEGNLIGMPSLLVRRECIEKAGLLHEGFQSLEDYEWILRLGKLYEAAYIDEIIVDVYAQAESVNRNLSVNFSARCILIGMYKEEMARYGVLESVVQEFLGEAGYLGCLEQVATALKQVLTS